MSRLGSCWLEEHREEQWVPLQTCGAIVGPVARAMAGAGGRRVEGRTLQNSW